VSVIFVVVSYRISVDVGVETQKKHMTKQANVLIRQIKQSEGETEANSSASELFEQLTDRDNADPLYIQVQHPTFSWSKSVLLSDPQINGLLDTIKKQSTDSRQLFNYNGKKYVWTVFKDNNYTVTFFQQTSALDLTLTYVAKRLSITAFIVFWISVWLALILSSFIAKRVKKAHSALAVLATTDTLTGLPNRLFLKELLQATLKVKKTRKTNTEAVNQGCIFVIDLDNFKEVNDAFGHSSGDLLLKEFATRFSATLDKQQVLVRLGGDEFIIWAPNIALNEARDLAKRLVLICEKPILINQLAVTTGASIGIAHYPSHGMNSEQLMINADTAMYKAKEQRCGWVVFDESGNDDFKMKIQLRAQLSDALSKEQFELYYQPKVHFQTGEIVGVEGLCRWNHPSLGLLAPAKFIELIEHSGRVQEFGRYIINTAIKQLSQWKALSITCPIAINLSPYNLLDPELINIIENTLKKYDVPPNRLEIELTENATSLNIKTIQSSLHAIKKLGLSLSIDDFGTGMSSLSYIANFDVDYLKIDRSFIFDIEHNHHHQAVVKSALILSKSFECSLVAEGVETEEQALVLQNLGCHYAQGFLYAKPMPAQQVAKLLIRNTELQNNNTPAIHFIQDSVDNLI
jgi:diguanylate cyclase (GGDEF)-like protein